MIWGEAAIDAPGKVTVKAAQERGAQGRARRRASYQAKHIIVATGARPRVLPGLEPDKKLVWTYFEAMVPDQHAEVAAGGRLGRHRHRVRLVLPHARRRSDGGRSAAADFAGRGRRDPAFARKSFEKQGIKIFTGAKVTKLDKKADSVTATIEDGKGKTQTHHRRARDLGRRRGRQYRKSRAREARREDRARLHQDRRILQDQRAGHLRHRRRLRPADAGAQGRARRRGLRRGDQGPASASDEQD